MKIISFLKHHKAFYFLGFFGVVFSIVFAPINNSFVFASDLVPINYGVYYPASFGSGSGSNLGYGVRDAITGSTDILGYGTDTLEHASSVRGIFYDSYDYYDSELGSIRSVPYSYFIHTRDSRSWWNVTGLFSGSFNALWESRFRTYYINTFGASPSSTDPIISGRYGLCSEGIINPFTILYYSGFYNRVVNFNSSSLGSVLDYYNKNYQPNVSLCGTVLDPSGGFNFVVKFDYTLNFGSSGTVSSSSGSLFSSAPLLPVVSLLSVNDISYSVYPIFSSSDSFYSFNQRSSGISLSDLHYRYSKPSVKNVSDIYNGSLNIDYSNLSIIGGYNLYCDLDFLTSSDFSISLPSDVLSFVLVYHFDSLEDNSYDTCSYYLLGVAKNTAFVSTLNGLRKCLFASHPVLGVHGTSYPYQFDGSYYYDFLTGYDPSSPTAIFAPVVFSFGESTSVPISNVPTVTSIPSATPSPSATPINVQIVPTQIINVEVNVTPTIEVNVSPSIEVNVTPTIEVNVTPSIEVNVTPSIDVNTNDPSGIDVSGSFLIGGSSGLGQSVSGADSFLSNFNSTFNSSGLANAISVCMAPFSLIRDSGSLGRVLCYFAPVCAFMTFVIGRYKKK